MFADRKSLIIGIIVGIVAVVGILCAVTGICASVNDLSFAGQLKEWFHAAETVAETVPEETYENAVTMLVR